MSSIPPPIIGLEDPLRVLLLLDYNTRVVVIGAMLLGAVRYTIISAGTLL